MLNEGLNLNLTLRPEINNAWSNPGPNVNVSDDVIQMSTVRCHRVCHCDSECHWDQCHNPRIMSFKHQCHYEDNQFYDKPAGI